MIVDAFQAHNHDEYTRILLVHSMAELKHLQSSDLSLLSEIDVPALDPNLHYEAHHVLELG